MRRRPAIATLAVTSGEPAGIGPEICTALVRRRWPCRLVVLGDKSLFDWPPGPGAGRTGFRDYDPASEPRTGVELLHVPLRRKARPGRLDPRNADYVLEMLDRASDGCISREFAGLVTAPVHKGIINDAGLPFTGHTEYLAARSGARQPVMMLVGGGMRVALATTHLPLREVAGAITASNLARVVATLERALRERFGIRKPRIVVCGLNPHAGEGGHLGSEEIEVIAPTLKRLARRGIRVSGPVPADTAFLPAVLDRCDAVLAMYHDQGLPVLKRASFGHAVNVTLGLPFVRTSVDHGTALEIAGTGRADPGSLLAAVGLAIELAASSGPNRR
ncbi:MAG TPA: 4-hydroxythreonine-4-phosphate dehydrogenase PdxA [Steroidobacteraceae bacterium]|nr:4-hydroxythreonine-4-phosphate dehydrogenase PdxA [Steroidobacteraceae bacterium]